jgi:hypothetical protein
MHGHQIDPRNGRYHDRLEGSTMFVLESIVCFDFVVLALSERREHASSTLRHIPDSVQSGNQTLYIKKAQDQVQEAALGSTPRPARVRKCTPAVSLVRA